MKKAPTTNQLLQLTQRELQKMTEKELRQAVSIVRSTARKRYERLTESEVYSPAQQKLWQGARDGAVLPTVTSLDSTQLLNEFKRYKSFLKSKTSTVKGAKKVNRNIREKTEQAMVESGETVPEDFNWLYYYHLVDRAEDMNVAGALHYRVIKNVVYDVYSQHPNSNKEDLLSQIESRLENANRQENPTTQIYTSQYV